MAGPDPVSGKDSALRGAFWGVLAALAYAVVRFRSGAGFASAVDGTPRLFYDFLHYYYASAEALVAGLNPVPGYLYSPALAILLMPSTLLGADLAMFFWAIFQGALLSLLVLRGVALGPEGVRGGFVSAFVVLTSAATLHSLKWGQLGLLIGVMMIEGVQALARRRERSAALLLGAAAALKFYPAILFALFLVRKRFLTLLFSALTAAALMWLPSLAVLGQRRTIRFYLRIARSFSDSAPSALADPNSQAVAAWLRRTFHQGSEAEAAMVGAFLALGAMVLLFRSEAAEFQGPGGERTILAGLILAALVPFFVVTCWPLYFCTLPALTLLTLARFLRREPSWLRLTVLGILAAGAVLQTYPTVDLSGGWDAYVQRGYLLVANLAVTGCAFLSLAPLKRP